MSLDYSSSYTHQWADQPVSYDLSNITMYPDSMYGSNAGGMAEPVSRDFLDNIVWPAQFDDRLSEDINTSTDPSRTDPAL